MRRPWRQPAVALAIVTTLLQTKVCFGEITTDVDNLSQFETNVDILSYNITHSDKIM